MQPSKIKKRRRANGKVTYYAEVNGKQHGLGTDYQKAKQQFAKLIGDQGADGTPNPLVCDLIGAFLAWSKRNQEAGTHRFYQSHLDHSQANKISFCAFTRGLRVLALKRHHVTKWLDENYADDSANYRNCAVRAVKRALQWAANEDHIAYSPLAKVKLPTPEHRDLVIDAETWQKLLGLLENKHGKNYDDFRDYLTLIWETGCRPQEVGTVEASFFNRTDRYWKFPVKKSKGKRKPRVVYLTDTAFAICERLSLKHPEGPLFRQQSGLPWDKNAIRCKFRRIKTKLGIPDLCAYTLRHSWATRMLQAGVDSHVVAKLMGHTTTRMLELRYSHIDQQPAFMLEQLKRA